MKKYNDILADERPEFKAANYGFDSLSNTELLSMVINRGAGTAESLSQARQLMNMADNNLSNLAKLSMDEMQVVQGIEIARAMAIRHGSRGTRQLPHEKKLTYTAPVSRGNCLRA